MSKHTAIGHKPFHISPLYNLHDYPEALENMQKRKETKKRGQSAKQGMKRYSLIRGFRVLSKTSSVALYKHL
jgi:hypothetical protein